MARPGRVAFDDILGHQTQPRPGAYEQWRAAARHDRMQLDAVFVDRAEIASNRGRYRTGVLDPGLLHGLDRTDLAIQTDAEPVALGATWAGLPDTAPFARPRARRGQERSCGSAVRRCIGSHPVTVPTRYGF